MPQTLRTETAAGVRHVVLTRAAEYNTITPALRDELAEAIDAADDDPAVHVILLRAEGPAFCAGYGLDWATAAQAAEARPPAESEGRAHAAEPRAEVHAAAIRPRASSPVAASKVWDSVADHRMMSRYVATYLKLGTRGSPRSPPCRAGASAAARTWCSAPTPLNV